MAERATASNHDELAQFIIEKFTALRPLMLQWADLARLALQGLPYDVQKLAIIETRINEIRTELGVLAIIASEHFTEAQLLDLQRQMCISKYGWRALKMQQSVTIKNGFKLLLY